MASGCFMENVSVGSWRAAVNFSPKGDDIMSMSNESFILATAALRLLRPQDEGVALEAELGHPRAGLGPHHPDAVGACLVSGIVLRLLDVFGSLR